MLHSYSSRAIAVMESIDTLVLQQIYERLL